MEQDSVNQRIKFLIEQKALSARAFSEAIQESPTNTHNYTGKRNSMPGADYLEKILLHFEDVNAHWLLTGQGAPFLFPPPAMNNETKATIKKTKGNVQANSGQTVNNITMEDCQRDLAICRAELEASRNEIKLLREQLEIKDSLVAAKDETINALRAHLPQPK
jgi:hypothetical protein